MTTMTLPVHQLGQVREGDKIVAIDGREVAGFTALGGISLAEGIAAHIPMKLAGRVAPVNLYLDSHVRQYVTIERPKRVVRRHFGEMTLVKRADGEWVTPDGKYRVSYEVSGYSECEKAHPVRRSTGAGDYCQGGEPHEYYQWYAYDESDPSSVQYVADGSVDGLVHFDTFTEIAQALAAVLACK